MDWKFSFVPNDTLDMTEREMQSKVNPKIVLTIRVGKGMLGAGMPVLLEDLAFSGHMRIKLKLFNEMPHVKTAEVSFLEKPQFDYVLKPVGGETFGFDINNVIRQIHIFSFYHLFTLFLDPWITNIHSRSSPF
jgi:Ca2+-dependent lipid-binding protein